MTNATTLELESLLDAPCTCSTQPRYCAIPASRARARGPLRSTWEEQRSVADVLEDRIGVYDTADEVLDWLAKNCRSDLDEWLEGYGPLREKIRAELKVEMEADAKRAMEAQTEVHDTLAEARVQRVQRAARAWQLLPRGWREPKRGLTRAYMGTLIDGKTWTDLPFGERYGGKVVTRRAALEVRDAVDKAWEEARS